MVYDASMGEPHVISRLKNKHQRSQGQLIDLKKQEYQLKADIAAIDHTLKVFGFNDKPHRSARYTSLQAHIRS